MIIAATTIWGCSKTSALKKRERELGKIITALSMLENEITYGKRDIKTALLTAGRVARVEMFIFAAENLEKGIKESMKRALDNCGEGLLGTDKSVLLTLSEILGMTNSEVQIKNIRYCIEQLKTLKEFAKNDFERLGKMYKGLGLLSGIFIVILLI